MTDFCLSAECWRPSFDGGLCHVCVEEEKKIKGEDPWMLTMTGQRFDFLEPRVDQVNITDIAWALSGSARFNGHTFYKNRYSVAQHSCLARTAAQIQGEGFLVQMQALLHDASDAYLPDMHSQLKGMFPGFKDLEGRVQSVIEDKFGIPSCKTPVIKEIDLRLLATELRDVMPIPPEPWTMLEGVTPYGSQIFTWTAGNAFQQFLSMFNELYTKIKEGV